MAIVRVGPTFRTFKPAWIQAQRATARANNHPSSAPSQSVMPTEKTEGHPVFVVDEFR